MEEAANDLRRWNRGQNHIDVPDCPFCTVRMGAMIATGIKFSFGGNDERRHEP